MRQSEGSAEGLGPIGQTRELAKKGVDGWIAGTGDRAIQLGIAALVGSAAVSALLAFLKAHWPIVAAGGAGSLVLFWFLARITKSYLGARAASRDNSEATRDLRDQVAALLKAGLSLRGQPAPGQVAGPRPPVMVFAPPMARELKGIGIVRSVRLTHIYASNPDYWTCVCKVDLVGLASNTEASPQELRLTGKGGTPELATLKTSRPANGSGTTEYVAQIEGRIVGAELSRTMFHPMAKWSLTTPASPSTFCELEVRLPSGHALSEHRKSAVCLDFELTNEPDPYCQVVVRVA